MTINQQNGIVRQVDLDRVKVTEANLETQKRNLVQALDVQKNLLKLQMGLNMNENIDIQIIDVQTMERETQVLPHINFSVEDLLPYQLMEEKSNLQCCSNARQSMKPCLR